MNLRPLKAEDFIFTNEDIDKALAELDFLANSPRPFGTFNPVSVLCALCQQPMDTGSHSCMAMIYCAACGDIHPIQHRSC